MKKRSVRNLIGCFLMAGVVLSGCGDNASEQRTDTSAAESVAVSGEVSTEDLSAVQDASEQTLSDQETSGQTAEDSSAEDSDTEDMIMEIQLGYNGQTVYRVQLYDNVTAQELYRDIGERHYNLPIYHYNDFEQADVIQYYDLPSRYSYTVEDAREVGAVKAGELYYSDPNRIILVYRDTTLEGEYVPIGMVEIDDPENFAKEMEDSEVLDYWNCKVVPVHRLGVAFSR